MTKLPSTISPLTDVLFITLSVSISFIIVLAMLVMFNTPCQSDNSVSIGNIQTVVDSQKACTHVMNESRTGETNMAESKPPC